MHKTVKEEFDVEFPFSIQIFKIRYNLFLLLSMKLNDESKNILVCKRAFTEVLEITISKFFTGGKPHTPIAQGHLASERFYKI